jgi:tRNA A-37 threonylcarbamoyl transferase component Bud32
MKTMVSTAGSSAQGGPASPEILLPGAKAGPWVIEREIGRGGMGAVYAVVHEDIGKRAALKVVHPRLLVPGFNTDRMLLEAKVVNQVGHPNIVDIFETGKLADGRPYIVMERLFGHTLSARADQCKLMPDLVIEILLQVCDALIAAHTAGIVHRDLKLDNVFLVDNPEDPAISKVKLLDWGIAKVMSHDAKYTMEGQLMGTPQYLAPEQARGQPVSPQTDVYSLGVMAYELFLEQPPFEAETAAEVMAMHLRAQPPPPRELWPDVPPVLEELLLAMLEKQPNKRPTMSEVTQRLGAVREEFARRRHVLPSARYPTAVPLEVPAPVRVITPAERAPAERAPTGHVAWRATATRWPYAVSAFALAAIAVLLGVARTGGESASAATVINERAVHVAGGKIVLPVALDRGAAALAAQPMVSDFELIPKSASPSAVPLPLQFPALPATTRAEPTAGAPLPAVRATASRPSSSHPSPHPTPARKPPSTPHRRSKLDPDGTLDPYR